MSTSAVMPLPLFRTNAHILRLPFELFSLADIVIDICVASRYFEYKPSSLSLISLLKLRSLRIHPPRLCRIAVFSIQTIPPLL